MRGYLHTSHLRWSYGAIKGRSGDWESQLAAKPLGLSVSAAAIAGFAGLYVDPRGYDDPPRPSLSQALQGLLGVAPLTSPRHDLWFFDLRPYARRLASAHTTRQLSALRDATLHPCARDADQPAFELDNPSSGPVAAVLSARVTIAAPPGATAPAAPGATIRAVYPDNSQQQLTLGRAPVTMTRRIELNPGRSSVRLTAIGRAPAAGLMVSEPSLTADAFAPFAAQAVATDPSLAGASGIVAPPCSIMPAVTR